MKINIVLEIFAGPHVDSFISKRSQVEGLLLEKGRNWWVSWAACPQNILCECVIHSIIASSARILPLQVYLCKWLLSQM